MRRATIGQPHCIRPETAPLSGLVLERRTGFWPALFRPHSYDHHLWNVSQDCLENIGALHSQRRPRAHEDWCAPARAEQRLLNQIDAILACGRDVIEKALNCLEDAEVPDPEWAFAVLLVLGCIPGEQAAQAAASAFKMVCERDRREGAAAVDALALSPNSSIASVFGPFLRYESPLQRCAAELLFRRYELSACQIEDLLQSGNADLIAIGLKAERNLRSWQGDVAPFLHHESDAVVYAALSVSFVRGDPACRSRSIELIKEGRPTFADAVFWLGIAGDVRDESLLTSLLSGPTIKRAAAALGYWGHPAAIPLLIQVLGEVPDEQKRSVAFALERITAAELSGWDTQAQELRVASSEQYESWQDKHASILLARDRLRRGRRFCPEVLISELECRAHSVAEREIAHLELIALHAGSPPRFRTDAFIAEQRTAILEWKQLWKIQ